MKASIDHDNVFLRSETLFCACATIFKTNSARANPFALRMRATGTFARAILAAITTKAHHASLRARES